MADDQHTTAAATTASARKRAAPPSKLALAGMICGLAGPFGVGFFGYWGIQFTVPAVILGVLALVLGYAGWYQIKSSDGRLGATWMAYLAWFFGVLAIAAPFTATV